MRRPRWPNCQLELRGPDLKFQNLDPALEDANPIFLLWALIWFIKWELKLVKVKASPWKLLRVSISS